MFNQSQFDGIASQDDESESAIATMEPAEIGRGQTAEWNGPRCEKCAAAIKSDVVTICRGCGWYASLGRFVEVDPNWELDTHTDEPAVAAQPSHLGVWLNLLPRWSWVIIATCLVIVIESIVARFATDGGLRTTWSLSQLAAGVLAFVGCHIFNFLVLAAGDSDIGVMDLLLKPIKLWLFAVYNLPTRLWVANTAASGVTAAAMSLLVIGGIPYDRLWDWGIDAPVKQELMGAVMDRVKELDSRNGADNLEDAIGDFAGTKDGLNEPKDPPKPRKKADCVILGYQIDRENKITALILGTTHSSNLVYAGNVTPKMSAGELAALLQMLSAVRTREPLIPIASDSAVWVKPRYACRVTFGESKKGRLSDIQWNRLMGTLASN